MTDERNNSDPDATRPMETTDPRLPSGDGLALGGLRAGARLGSFRIECLIGEGGMGQVWKAHDMSLKRDVAIKVLSPERTGNARLERRFEREARVLAKLRHPHIVRISDAGSIRGVRYLVMDYVQGRSLAEVLARLRDAEAPLDGRAWLNAIEGLPSRSYEALIGLTQDRWSVAARIMRTICDAVAAAHASEVMHRDLKPQNVMMTAGGNPVVLDFGLAGEEREATGSLTSGFAGTLGYLAPEQARTQRVGFDYRTDVYQLGLILYELLTLRRAYRGDVASLRDIEFGQFKLPRRVCAAIPRDLEAICVNALEPDLERRTPSAEAMAADLERWCTGQPIHCRPPSVLRRAQLLARRNRKPLLAATLALLVGGVLGFGYWRTSRIQAVPIVAFRFDPTAAEPVERSPRQVSDGDYFGVEIDLARPASLWALSAAGPRADARGPSWIRVLHPMTESQFEQLVRSKDVRAQPRLDLGAGKHRIYLSRITASAEMASDWIEGFWIFCSGEEPKWLTTWIEVLQKKEEALARTASGVAFADALRSLPPANSRGERIWASKRDREALLAALGRSERAHPELPFPEPRPFTAYVRIRRRR